MLGIHLSASPSPMTRRAGEAILAGSRMALSSTPGGKGSWLGSPERAEREGRTMTHRTMAIVLIGMMCLAVSACAAAGPGRDAGASLRARHALGVQRVLVLGVSFPDVEPGRSLDYLRDHVLERTARYYAGASYGKTTLAGEVKGWYRLPRPLDDYRVSPYNIEVDRSRVWRLVEDALNAAEPDVAFDRYDHIVVVVGVDTRPGVGYGMIAYSANPGFLSRGGRRGDIRMEAITTRGGQRFGGGIIVVAQNAHVGHIVHDLAHALGGAVEGRRPIPDLYDTVLQGRVGPLSIESFPKFTVFMGPWDVMSSHLVQPRQPPPGMSSFTRLRMGWIAEDQVADLAPGESRAVRLGALGRGRGTLAIRIPGPWGTHYLLENRQNVPGDPVLPATGLLALHVDESRLDGDGIVRVVDADPSTPDFGAATHGVGPGQTSSLALPRNVAVEVLWQEHEDLLVVVTTRASAAEIRRVAGRIRAMEQKLEGAPPSPASASARANLSAAKELLLQMKAGEAGRRLE